MFSDISGFFICLYFLVNYTLFTHNRRTIHAEYTHYSEYCRVETLKLFLYKYLQIRKFFTTFATDSYAGGSMSREKRFVMVLSG